MNRSKSVDWIDCFGEAIENAENGNQWMDTDFWIWMMLVADRLIRERPEICERVQPALQTLAQTYDQQPAHDGLRGMLTVIKEANGAVASPSGWFPKAGHVTGLGD